METIGFLAPSSTQARITRLSLFSISASPRWTNKRNNIDGFAVWMWTRNNIDRFPVSKDHQITRTRTQEHNSRQQNIPPTRTQSEQRRNDAEKLKSSSPPTRSECEIQQSPKRIVYGSRGWACSPSRRHRAEKEKETPGALGGHGVAASTPPPPLRHLDIFEGAPLRLPKPLSDTGGR